MEIGIQLYRAIIRSKIDYGSIVYGAANAATLKSPEVVANEAMRITSGAFISTPVSSMQVMNSEPPLELRTVIAEIFFQIQVPCAIVHSPAYGCVCHK